MFNPLVIISVILAIIIIVSFALNFRSQAEREKQPENKPLMDNFEPQISGGHSLGVVNKVDYSQKRVRVEFLPRDYNLPKETKDNKNFEVKPYTLFFDKKQFDTYSGWSSHVPRIIAFPDSADKVPEELLQKFPEIAMKIERNNQMKDTSELYKMRMENLSRVAKLTTGGEIFRKEALTQKEMLKDRTELKIDLNKDDKK